MKLLYAQKTCNRKTLQKSVSALQNFLIWMSLIEPCIHMRDEFVHAQPVMNIES